MGWLLLQQLEKESDNIRAHSLGVEAVQMPSWSIFCYLKEALGSDVIYDLVLNQETPNSSGRVLHYIVHRPMAPESCNLTTSSGVNRKTVHLHRIHFQIVRLIAKMWCDIGLLSLKSNLHEISRGRIMKATGQMQLVHISDAGTGESDS